MPPTTPKHIGRYQIISQLAEGKGNRVFLAIHRSSTGLCKTAVLKQVQHDPHWSPEQVARFLEEARLTARLNHANIVKTYQLLNEGSDSYLVMEQLEGQSLFKILQRLPQKEFPLEEHIWILSQILSGLHYAHTFTNYDGAPLGIVHGDMKPVNVFITYQGEVKLFGFGMSQLVHSAKADEISASGANFSYHAPKHSPDATPLLSGDLYSVGVMLREALLRIPATADSMPSEPTKKPKEGEYEFLQSFRTDLPLELTQICDRTLAPDSVERFTTAAEFQRALHRYLAELPKPIEPGAIATRLQTHFSVERQAISQLVADQMAIPQETNWAPPSGSGRHQDQVTTKEVPVVLAPPTRPHGFKARYLKFAPLFFSLVLIALIAAMVAVIRWNPRQSPAQIVITPQITNPPKPKLATAPSPATISMLPPASTPTEMVQVSIQVTPKVAKLSLDGHEVTENPFQTLVPKDQATHTISAMAPGFIPYTKQTQFSNDLNLMITLRPHHTAIPRIVKAPRLITKEPPQLRSPSTPPATEPGMHLTRSPSRRNPRQLDEKDPYIP